MVVGAGDGLVLTVGEFAADADGIAWSWSLVTADGVAVGGHRARVRVGTWQYEAFTDLDRFLWRHSAPDNRTARQAEILAEFGRWVADELYGAEIAAEMARRRGVVRVVIPREARALAYHPLEAAVVGGQSLAAGGVTLVLDLGRDPVPERPDVGDRLRVLALFSLPEGPSALNLRKERTMLAGLFDMIAEDRGLAIELRTLQYGVTRERLRRIAAEEAGWDVLHLAGHGDRGAFHLERSDGRPDRVSSGELLDLVAPLAGRTRLVVMSSCSSANVPLDEQRRLLKLPVPGRSPDRAPAEGGALATELAGRLGCAVVGMRYPVTEDYAIAFGAALYEHLLGRGTTVGRAVAEAVTRATPAEPTPYLPPISAVTPVVVGASAATLTFAAPARVRPAVTSPDRSESPEPARWFVGRSAIMARANEVLAARSGRTGVLLYGMSGIGKTAIAHELADLRRDDFSAVIWFRVPDEPRASAGALFDLAATLEQRIGGLRLVHLLDGDAPLPDLSGERVLLVVDNVESLLDDSGAWRDERWGAVLDVLTGHDGVLRVILTSRHPPASLGPGVVREPVHPLSDDEALLLAREFPALRRLMDSAGSSGGDRRLVAQVLAATGGHPLLLELAAGQAADPLRLRILVHAAGGPQAGYAGLLSSWTERALSGLTPPARLFAQLVACAEEVHRETHCLGTCWDDLTDRLGRAGSPPLPDLIQELTGSALVSTSPWRGETRFTVHPGVAAALRAAAGPEIRRAADTALAEFWLRCFFASWQRPEEERFARFAAHSALPYAVRCEHGAESLVFLVRNILDRDDSAATCAALLPFARDAERAARGTEFEREAVQLLSIALLPVDPDQAERRLRELLQEKDDPQTRRILSNHYMKSGRVAKGLDVADWSAADATRADDSPEARFDEEIIGLQRLSAMGWDEQVLRLGRPLLEALDDPPERGGLSPATNRHAQEQLLSTLVAAAAQSGHDEEALQFLDRLVESLRRHRAPALKIFGYRVHQAEVLVDLQRLDEAERLLDGCRAVFEQHRAWEELGRTFAALARLENGRERPQRAARFNQDALRYGYRALIPSSIIPAHINLGISLRRAGDNAGAVAHQLAGLLIEALTVKGLDDRHVHNAAMALTIVAGEQLFQPGSEPRSPDVPVPGGVDELCAIVQRVPGVRLRRLLDEVTTPQKAQQAFEQVLDAVRDEEHALTTEIRQISQTITEMENDQQDQ